ncbi:RND family transporter, partial [bacterium]|nr:RND family transporter [bacterium]
MKIPDLIIKFRLLIIIVFVISALVLGGNIRNAQIDPDIINQIPEDMPSRIQTDRIEEIFGGIDMSMILVSADDVLDEDTLRWLKTVSKKVNRIKGV